MIGQQNHRRLQTVFIILSIVFFMLLIIQLLLLKNLVNNSDTVSPAMDVTIPKMNDATSTINSIEKYSAIADRPLFSSTRRPPVIVTHVEPVNNEFNIKPVQTTQEANLYLSGIAIAEGQRLALIGIMGNNKLEKLMVGESINGWTVSEIKSTQVVLKLNDKLLVLELMVKVQR